MKQPGSNGENMHNLQKKAAARHVLTPSILAVRQLLHRRAALHVSVRNFPWECLIWMRIRIIQSDHCFRMKMSLKNRMISLDTSSDLTYDTCEIRRVLGWQHDPEVCFHCPDMTPRTDTKGVWLSTKDLWKEKYRAILKWFLYLKTTLIFLHSR